LRKGKGKENDGFLEKARRREGERELVGRKKIGKGWL
jgi:hypothetical protein